MAITGSALLAPRGALTPELLLALRSLVTGATTAAQVAAAYARVGTEQVAEWTDEERADRGAVAWATHRALLDRAQQILTAAQSLSTDGTSRSYAVGQATEMKKDAASFLAAYEREAAAEVAAGVVPVEATPLRGTRSVPIQVSW